MTESKSVALPLGDSPMFSDNDSYYTLSGIKCQEFFEKNLKIFLNIFYNIFANKNMP